jgi:hypothetical protein
MACLAGAGTAIANDEPARPATEPDAKPATERKIDPKIDQILTRVESRGKELRNIECKIRVFDDDKIMLTQSLRTGSVRYMVTEPNPIWMIHFERVEVDGSRLKQEWYLFDGKWLYDVQERIKQITKYDYASSGEKIDFFDIERSPFPMPFGQKKTQILDNFEVSLVEPGKKDPPNTDHLVCIPRTGSRLARDYTMLEFFIRRDLNLPSRIIVRKNDGDDIRTVDFPDLSEKTINAGLDKKAFARPKAWSGFEEVMGQSN